MKLVGQVAVVTGGSRGIGKAIAAALLAEGAIAVVMARTGSAVENAVAELSSLGSVTGFACDIGVPQQVKVLFETIIRQHGPIDILVNNAGVQGPIGPLWENDPGAWWRTLQTNLLGVFLCCRAVLPEMIERRRGKIINLSGGGATASRPFFSAYAASKSAIVRLTETLAEEVRPYGIQVNAIAPGAVNTRMLDEVLAAGSVAGETALDEARRQKKHGGVRPERAAELVVFLASDDSAGITGKLIGAVYDEWWDWPKRVELLASSDLYTLRRLDPFTIRKVSPDWRATRE
jgi:3-oxoacyl-[acyl-carrier protein] reductase